MTTLGYDAGTVAVRTLREGGPRVRLELSTTPAWLARLNVHLAVASIPVLAISADVFGWVSLGTVAVFVMAPLAIALVLLVARRQAPGDRLLLAGFVSGLVACAAYDAFRLPTIYGLHLWGDFFGSVGGWATGTSSNFAVGYLWRYVGDGGGIAVAFFALAATLSAGRLSKRSVVGLGVAYAVFPVWTGLVLTDALAPAGHALFPLTTTTLLLSLGGHLIYGTVLGLGYWLCRLLETEWPLRIARSQGGRTGESTPSIPVLLPASIRRKVSAA
jgi:hypothetical protein